MGVTIGLFYIIMVNRKKVLRLFVLTNYFKSNVIQVGIVVVLIQAVYFQNAILLFSKHFDYFQACKKMVRSERFPGSRQSKTSTKNSLGRTNRRKLRNIR
jgi:hypothetical protein